MEFITNLDLQTLIKTVGYIGLFAITAAESGLFIGFFLPGDSLLFTAGFLASQGFLDLPVLITTVFLGAIIGDTIGYTFGKHVGPKIFTREDSLLFHKKHLTRTQAFYERHGGKTIIIARFMPIVRTFAPILAGVGLMPYSKFVFYNITGAVLWAGGLTSLGYLLGATIPGADKYLLPIVILIILISVSPTIIHVLRDPELRQSIINRFFKRV